MFSLLIPYARSLASGRRLRVSKLNSFRQQRRVARRKVRLHHALLSDEQMHRVCLESLILDLYNPARLNYYAPCTGAEYCDERVSLSVRTHTNLWSQNHMSRLRRIFCACYACQCIAVAIRRILSVSVYDVMFTHNGQEQTTPERYSYSQRLSRRHHRTGAESDV